MTTNIEVPEYLTAKQTARLLGFHYVYFMRVTYAGTGPVQGEKHGSRWRFKREDVLSYIANEMAERGLIAVMAFDGPAR
jgi:hypothetical protein